MKTTMQLLSFMPPQQYYRMLNRVLVISVIVCGSGIVVSLLYNPQPVAKSERTGNESLQGARLLTMDDLVAFKKQVSSRELFRAIVVSGKSTEIKKTITDFTKDLMLVGVVSVGNKEAIIKDRRTRQTFFVTIGSRVGEITVSEIRDDRIEVTYGQERTELFLR